MPKTPKAPTANPPVSSRLPKYVPVTTFPPGAIRSWTRFLKAYKVVTGKVDEDVAAATGLTVAEYEVLAYLNEAHGRMRFIDLSRLCLLSESQISRRIDTLIKKGHVERIITASDRRATFALLTHNGAREFVKAEKVFADSFRKNFLKFIPNDQLVQFSDMMENMIQDESYSPRARTILAKARELNEAYDG